MQLKKIAAYNSETDLIKEYTSSELEHENWQTTYFKSFAINVGKILARYNYNNFQ